jgi:acetamidase/formamidase
VGVVPAPEAGRHVSSNSPGRHAANLDTRGLVAGSTLYIPVSADGALSRSDIPSRLTAKVIRPQSRLSLRARLQLTVRKDVKLTWPPAQTPTDYISMATD